MKRTDRNGYAPSILQNEAEQYRCYLCGKTCEKLDRHEVFHGSNRQKSKGFGLWVMLCHTSCHLNGVHRDGELNNRLQQEAQEKAMDLYGWNVEDFRGYFGKSYL